jgi:hypothetical protein
MTIVRFFSTTVLAVGLVALPALAQTPAQPPPQSPGENIQPRSAAGHEPTETSFQKDQILTATVHQAWLLSGKNEANFFEIVEQLAQISAANRGIALPESEAVGRRMGEAIKRGARADSDQLLYALVDKALLDSVHPVRTKPSTQPTAKPSGESK